MSESSAAVLRRLLEQCMQRWARQFPRGSRLSARDVSGWLSKPPNERKPKPGTDCGLAAPRTPHDRLCMARWTNEKAHQGSHPNWRIPFYRIDQACAAVGASTEERDELMAARIQEAAEHDPDSDVAVVLDWLAQRFEPLFAQLQEHGAITEDERTVLRAYRAAVKAVPGARHAPLPSSFEKDVRSRLVLQLEQAVGMHVREMETERACDEGTMDEAQLQAAIEQSQAAVALALNRKPPETSADAAQRAKRDIVRKALQQCRQAREARIKERSPDPTAIAPR